MHSHFCSPAAYYYPMRGGPTPPRRPALQERYERRRRRIVYEAAKVFAQRGYDQTTMADLAASLGLATGALYHYFDSKEQLLIGICDQLMDPLLDQAREIMGRDDQSPEERLRQLVRIWVACVIDHRHHMRVFQQERHVIEVGEQWRGVRDSRKAFERLVDRALRGAHATGGAQIDTRLALVALLGMVNHTALWYRPRGRYSPSEIAEGYLALLVGGGGADAADELEPPVPADVPVSLARARRGRAMPRPEPAAG
jgi:TetR/AcrR family transcriptional regulator, cholesterol catabolism regulator